MKIWTSFAFPAWISARWIIVLGLACAAIIDCFGADTSGIGTLDKRVLEAEQRRIDVIAKVRPSVVAIFAQGGQGGGSGVLIDPNGYALTNFHVVQGSGPVMQCGLPDGVLYDAVLVGLDRVGDVALIKLLPKIANQPFPCAVLGDSDKVKAGDWALALGNPFLLATDFQPTVTYGLVSGIHRYQYPAGTLLEYTDCIQVDTSINPGNSGGPLFSADGELIGINGRISLEKRGRVNSGVGYAISINQIKNFLGHLRAGLDADHATLGASVQSDSEEGSNIKLVIGSVLENADAQRRGLEENDELVSFAGRPMTSVNQYKNVLGLFPKGWRVPLVYRRNNEKREILVRLMQLQQSQVGDENRPKPPPRPPRPQPPPRKSPASILYVPKQGYANYHFNKLERDRLLAAFRSHGNFGALSGDWSFEGQLELKQKKVNVQMAIRDELPEKNLDGKSSGGESTYFLKPEFLTPLPEADAQANQSVMRRAMVEAAKLLRKHARSFPQEFWAESTEAQQKENVVEVQKDVATIQASLLEALEELQKAAAAPNQDLSERERAQFDYTQARLMGFCAYLHEYNFMLGQLRKEVTPRDPKVHRGWRMVPQDVLQSGAEAKKLASDGHKTWDAMIKKFKGTQWEELAKQSRQMQLGLKWVPTGGTQTVVRLDLGDLKYRLEPLKPEQELGFLKEPKNSGGFLEAMYQFRRLLTLGEAGFEANFSHGGYEPFYAPLQDGAQPKNLGELRLETEVLHTEHAAVPVKWYFSRNDQTLVGFEATIDKDDDPCEVYLSNYRTIDGRSLPYRMEVRHGNATFGVITIDRYGLSAAR